MSPSDPPYRCMVCQTWNQYGFAACSGCGTMPLPKTNPRDKQLGKIGQAWLALSRIAVLVELGGTLVIAFRVGQTHPNGDQVLFAIGLFFAFGYTLDGILGKERRQSPLSYFAACLFSVLLSALLYSVDLLHAAGANLAATVLLGAGFRQRYLRDQVR